jgi:putative ABC transport system permease protein
MIYDTFLLALKNLRSRGIRSWLTLLGIFIGVTAVVALISLGNGLQLAVSSQFGIAQTEVITIQASGAQGFGPPGSTTVTPLDEDDLNGIERIGSVKRAVPRYIESGKLEYNDRVIFGYATNVPSGDNRDFIYEQVGEAEAGRLLKESDHKKVILGHNFYVNKVGLEKEVIPGKTILLNEEEFEVVGILEKKGSFIFDNAVLMNDKDIIDLFNIEDEIDVIIAQPKDKNQMDRVKEEIEKSLRKTRGVREGEENFEVSTPEAALSTINGILAGVKAFVVLVALISVFIGAIGIVNTMTTSVLERRKEIGIMKSIGARNNHIFMQFFIESGLLGLLGGAIGALFGTLIGILGTVGINSWIGADIGIKINFGLIFLSLLGSFIIGAVSGISPALAAAKQNPVEALRS